MIVRFAAAVGVALAIVGLTDCASKNQFVGTWQFVSAAPRPAPVVLNRLIITNDSVDFVSNNGSEATYSYTLASATKALVSGGFGGVALTLVSSDTLRLSDPDSTYARSK